MQTERDQLQQFDEEVFAHPESAQSFATNGFLNVLASVFDNGEFDLKLFKDALRAFATILPHFFNTVIQNETETHMWETTCRLSDTVLNSLLNHQNPGIRVHAVKCLQVLATIFSRPDRKIRDDISLNLIRTQHRLLNTQELEAKGEKAVHMLLNKLEDQSEKINVLSAIVNSMVPLVRKRPQFLAQVSKAYVHWWKTRPQNMTPIQKKSADKVVKVAFVTLIRADELSQQRNDLINAFGAVNGNTAVFLRSSRGERDRRENADDSRRAKRPITGPDGTPEKRIKVAGSSPQPSTVSTPPKPPQAPIINPFTNFDITTIPLPTIIELCIAALSNVSIETIKERIDTLPPSGLMGTAPTSGSAASHAAAGAPAAAATTAAAATAAATATPPPPTLPTLQATDTKLHREEVESKEYKSFKAIDTKGTPGTSRVPLASVKERASESLRMKPFELPAPKPLSPSEAADYIKQSVQRILDAESYLLPRVADNTATSRTTPIWNQSAKTVWLLIVSKLLTRGITTPGKPDDQSDMDIDHPLPGTSRDLKEMLVNFIIDDLPARLELALEWLHEEFETDTLRKRTDPNYEPQYFKWLLHLLHRGIPTLDAKDKTLAKLFLDAPALNDDAIDILHKIMREESERFVACVSTLRDLVTNRPPVRDKCLDVLLEYCINPDVRMRSTSIVAVRRWVPDHRAIAARVEQYAVQAFQKLTQEPPPVPKSEQEPKKPEPPQQDGEDIIIGEDRENGKEHGETRSEQAEEQEEEEKEENGWREVDVVRHSELLFALCAKNNELLDDLFKVYIATTEQVQRIIRQHIYQLIKTIGMQSPKLLDIIRHFPPGSETLVIRILVTLCDTVRPTPELVEAVKSVHKERNLDAKFIVPIVSGLTKDDVKRNLPQIIDLLNSSETQRKIVKKVFSRIVSSGASAAAPMTPPELLLALHELEESVPLPKAVEAINVCFTMPETFEAKHVLLALRHLVDQPKIPLLLMVTMIRTVSVYKELIPFVLTLLQTLISKKIWMYPKLWDGFVKCAERTQPDSVKIVASLPKAQLQDILQRIPSIRSPLRDYAEENQFVRVLVEMKEMGLIKDEEEEKQ